MLDRGGAVNFFGSTLQIAPQLRFADLASAQQYIDDVLSLPAVAARGTNPIRVRQRRGGSRAHYADGVIALPIQELWAGRESVVLHEIAHHLNGGVLHDAAFRSTMITLVTAAQSVESALLLRVAYAEALRT